MTQKFDYKLVHPYTERINTQRDFVDIEVEFEGRTYKGSLTTPEFIKGRLKDHSKTGENGNGSYFCAKGMLVLKNLKQGTIKRTLQDLIERGDLKEFLGA